MGGLRRLALTCLFAGLLCGGACEIAGAVEHEDIDAHVRAQFQKFGPQSKQREFFGYVYRQDGVLSSAVVRGQKCSSARICGVDIAPAARLVPAGARVLGEWHTHPHRGSSQLSSEDVQGAHDNRHILGYRAYYSIPNGEIYSWDPRQDRVQTAMASRLLIGNYRTVQRR